MSEAILRIPANQSVLRQQAQRYIIQNRSASSETLANLEPRKRLLILIFTSKAAVSEKSDFFIRAIATLRLQLQHCKDAEGGLIDLADEGGSLLKTLLIRFRNGLEGIDSIGVSDIADELDDLEDYLRQEHGW